MTGTTCGTILRGPRRRSLLLIILHCSLINVPKEVIKAFGLQGKLGYFTLDNATNNDTAIADLASEFGFDPLQRRVRCFGHIINLVVKALLFGSDDEAFDNAVE